ncbi:MAG: extracellular solute-binding protein [Chloroflexota bacterium]
MSPTKKVWKDGFASGFVDRDKQFAYAAFAVKSRFLWINTEMVKDGEITNAQDLTNPKWKGKIITGDPRVNGAGSVPASTLRTLFGDDIVKKIWKDQEPTLSRDNRQMTEFMVRGRYAIGIGVPTENIFPEFLAQGLGKQLKYIEVEGMDQVSSGQDVLYYFDKAPHPSAAKLFINWFLTKEGQSVWAKLAPNNSRRSDVPPGLPDSVAASGKKYLVGDSWDNKDLIPEIQKLARQLLD